MSETSREEFVRIFSIKRGELDGHTYKGFRPNVLPDEVWSWHASQLQRERQRVLEEVRTRVLREIGQHDSPHPHNNCTYCRVASVFERALKDHPSS